MNDVLIRLAKHDEVTIIAEVKRKCWLTTYRGIYDDNLLDNFNYEKTAHTFSSIIDDEDSELYVAEVDNKIVGFLSYGKPLHAFGDYEQELSMLYILEEYRGQGIGTLMFQLAKDNIKRKGYDRFIVSANKYNNKARDFYIKMGGEEIHVDPDNEDKRSVQVKYEVKI